VILLLLMFWVNVSGNLKFFFSVILVVFIYLSVVSPPIFNVTLPCGFYLLNGGLKQLIDVVFCLIPSS